MYAVIGYDHDTKRSMVDMKRLTVDMKRRAIDNKRSMGATKPIHDGYQTVDG